MNNLTRTSRDAIKASHSADKLLLLKMDNASVIMNKHTFSPYDQDLNQLRQRVLLMGQNVCQQTRDAMLGFAEGNRDLIEQVILRDKLVNREEIDLDEMCVQIIVRHAPAASDLRMLTSTMQMITDLERVGDEAKKIAKAARQMQGADPATVPEIKLFKIAEHVVQMLEQALDAYVRWDVTAAPAIAREDKDVDSIIKAAVVDLSESMQRSSATVVHGINMLQIARSIERVGDHATNIAKYVVFMSRGEDVRHRSIKHIERAIRPED